MDNEYDESQCPLIDDNSCSSEEDEPEEEMGLEQNRVFNEFAILTAECIPQAPLTDSDLPRAQPPGLEDLRRVDAFGTTKFCPVRCNRPSCNGNTVLSFFKAVFPIIHWLPRYQIKSYAVLDIAAGLTLGVMLIPQGMAYAFLADIPPIYGLYTCLFPPIIYLLMGTSRHMSVGAFSLVSILAGQAISDYMNLHKNTGQGGVLTVMNETTHPANSSVPGNNNSDDIILYATTLSFLVGIVQIVMAIFHLGFLATYLSDALISGFTTGAAIQIATSQLSSVMGFESSSMPHGLFNVPRRWLYLFEHVSDINVACFLIALVSAVVLVVCRMLSAKLQLKFPIPGELMVVSFGTALSWAFSFKENYSVPILNHIPSGIPAPKVPPLSTALLKSFAGGTIIVSVIGYVVSVSIALTFANKLSYPVRPNQELLSLGIANLFGSFFSCFPSSGSLSRSSIVASTGGKTLVSTLIGTMVVLIAIVALAQLFQTLPNAVLGAIIVIALKGLFGQFADVKRLWKVKKVDCFVWCFAFLGVVIINITYGLMVGLGAAVITMFYSLSTPQCELLERADGPNGVRYTSAKFSLEQCHSNINVSDDMSLIKVFRVHGPLLYFNQSYIFAKLSELACLPTASESSESSDSELMISNQALVKGIVLEASTLTSIDSAGVAALVKAILAYELCGMYLVLANCNESVKDVLLRSGFQAKLGHKHLLFKTTENAVRYIFSKEYCPITRDEGGRLLESFSRITQRRNISVMDEMNSFG